MAHKKSWGWMVAIGFMLTAGYFLTRLPNLTALPIFTDEAIYIRWSQIGASDAAWRFISLTDGKQPMFTWVMMMLLKLFAGYDPLFVGRITSVVAGFFTLTGLLLLSYTLFRSKKISILTGCLYIILPFTAWYDRVALYDSMVSMFSVWSLYLGVLLVKYVKTDIALVLGMVLASGMLNKSSGFLSAYFLPVTLLLFDWKNPKRLIRWCLLIALSCVLSQVLYSVLRLSPYFHIVGQKNNVFVFSLTEWMDQPFRFFAGNLTGMFDWVRSYMTPAIFIAAFASFFGRTPHAKERMVLFFWWFLPFVALANFGKVLYPRFVLFMTMPLIMLAAYSYGQARTIFWKSIGLLTVIPALIITFGIVSHPESARIPFADRGQFMDDWPAGGGVRETVAFLQSQTANQTIHVYTEGTFGLLPYALEIYLVNKPTIKISGLWPLPAVMPEEMNTSASMYPTYFILNATQIAPAGWPLELIGEYKKGNSPENRKLRLYRVNTSTQKHL